MDKQLENLRNRLRAIDEDIAYMEACGESDTDSCWDAKFDSTQLSNHIEDLEFEDRRREQNIHPFFDIIRESLGPTLILSAIPTMSDQTEVSWCVNMTHCIPLSGMCLAIAV